MFPLDHKASTGGGRALKFLSLRGKRGRENNPDLLRHLSAFVWRYHLPLEQDFDQAATCQTCLALSYQRFGASWWSAEAEGTVVRNPCSTLEGASETQGKGASKASVHQVFWGPCDSLGLMGCVFFLR